MYNTGAVRAVAENVGQVLEHMGFPAHVHAVEVEGLPWSWVAPDPSWPNYRQAKIGAGVLAGGERLWAGIRWDKGLGLRARGYIAERPMLMANDGDWEWTRLMARLPLLQEAMANTKGPAPLVATLSFGNGVEPGFRPFGSRLKHVVAWNVQAEQLVLAEPVYDIGAAQSVKDAPDLVEAMRRLEEGTDWDWTWVTFSLGWYQPAPDRPSLGARLGRELLVGWLDPLLPFYMELKEVTPSG